MMVDSNETWNFNYQNSGFPATNDEDLLIYCQHFLNPIGAIVPRLIVSVWLQPVDVDGLGPSIWD